MLMSSKKYADIFRKTSACFFIFCTNFTVLSIMFFQNLFKKFLMERILFQKAALLKEKNSRRDS